MGYGEGHYFYKFILLILGLQILHALIEDLMVPLTPRDVDGNRNC